MDRPRILIVEDEPALVEAYKRVLLEAGYDVWSTPTGEEALTLFAQFDPHLVLLDLGLPVKDGRDTLIWLGEVNPLLPVIIITGRSHQRELAKKLGADAIMEKPLDVPCLLQTIRELLNEPPEGRARRASGFRCVPCDHDLFLKSLHERLTAPYIFSGSNDR